ncbi:hypothetical protein HZB03_05760 [Candidatus Woesearchaeota archaeon]|nr:hypothetical protein [Candidatus Woesearchaeota archaeon]
MFRRKSRKAQIVGQVFIYAISIIMITLILAYGYKAIKDFSKRGEEVALITLKSSVQNAFRGILSDYGTIKRPDLDIPGNYKKVCFIESGSSGVGTPLCMAGTTDYEPLVCSAWGGRDNAFLIPDGSDAFNVGEITIEGGVPYACFDVVNNKINLQLKSLGDKVEISTYE